MTGKQWSVIGAVLVSVAAIISGLPSWGDVLKPGVMAGLMGAIGSTLAGLYSTPPTR